MADFCEKTTNLLRTFVNKICNIQLSHKSFPGGLPVSISRNLLKRIAGIHKETHLEYVLSYKADGQRKYLGFICIEGEFISFLQDRQGKFTRIDLEMYPIAYEGTLFDVEQLDDKTFLIFDCACIHGNVCKEEFYPNRLELARVCLATCEKDLKYESKVVRESSDFEYRSNYPDIVVNTGKWKLKVKALFHASYIDKLPPKWLYKDDGFIWTLATAPFHVFRGHKLAVLKWKPPERITIDFTITATPMTINFDTYIPEVPPKLSRTYRTRSGTHRLLTHHQGKVIWFSSMDTNVENGVYECSWLKLEQRWHIELFRPDKSDANSLTTVVNTIKNIEECITRKDLESI